jgi:hypothetical protein
MANCGKTFVDLVKAAMIPPQVCKLRKNCQSGIDQCAMVLKKHLHFLIFKLPKAEQRPLRICKLWRG